MVKGVGVSDEQLDEWGEDTRASVLAFGSSRSNERVLALIGEVRASHAREAELRAAVESAESARAHTVVLFSESTEALKRYALEGERDVLQERIDKALAVLVDADAVSEYLRMGVRGLVETESVRAALTGTGDTE